MTKAKKILLTLFVITSVFFGSYYGIQGLESLSKNAPSFGAVSDIYSPYKLEGFGNGWQTWTEFDSKELPDDSLVQADNIDFATKSGIAPRSGTSIIGTSSATTTAITGLHTSRSIRGREMMVRSYDTVIEWYNPDNSTWENLDTGYTSGKEFTFADGNNSNETEIYTYFANNYEAIRRFRVSFGSVSTSTSNSLTLNSVTGFSDATDLGFASSSATIRIGGQNYTYNGVSGWTLLNLATTTASGTLSYASNAGVVGAVQTSGFSNAPTSASALVIKDQRMYAAYKNSVYCSVIDSLQDFGFHAPRVAGDGEIVFFPDGGQKINGLGVRPSYVAVFKNDYVGSLSFDTIGNFEDIPVIKTIAKGINMGAVNQKSIDNNNFEVIYANNEIGISTITRLSQTDYDQTIQMTEKIRPTLEGYSFANSALVTSGNVILNAASDNADFNNVIIYYNALYKRFTLFRGLNANFFTVYGGKIYYGDSVNANVFQLFADSHEDNGSSYSTAFKTKWFNFGEPSRWKELGFVWVEGFITTNTELQFSINLDEGGSLSTKEVTISGLGRYVSSPPPSGFGLNPFGLSNFSTTQSGTDNLLHFAGYINTSDLTSHKFRNVQFGGHTDGENQDYRITKIIPYYYVLDEQYGRSINNYNLR